MATITTDTYLDGGVARTAGEAMTITTGAKLTIRTDTRVHANAPASMTGSLGSITVTEGELFIDATKVRWLAYTDGSGNVPSIGDTISQGGTSGYILGVWASITSAPTTAGSAMPTAGFIKFREVTGVFSSGSLSGITATASGADVTGWIEVVHDQAATFSVPRLGSYTTRGDWFELDSTNGVVGQVVQVPTNNGGANTIVPAIWVETGVGTGEFEIYPSLYGASNGWAKNHIGTVAAEQDSRQKFVKSIGSGQVQIGESDVQAGTYENTASQASTYSTVAHTGTYTWVNDVITVYCSGGHFLDSGDTTGLDFTSGSGVDGIYTVTALNAYYFTVSLSGSGTGGNVTSRAYVAVSLALNGNNIGFSLYCDFTSGTGVDGVYTVKAVSTSTIYWIGYPHTVALTSGNVTVNKGITGTTSVAHEMNIGSRVDLAFDADSSLDGFYTVESVPTTTTFTINTGAIAVGGNITITRQIGYVPEAGCKIRIPNIIGRQCTTSSRSVNAAPHATMSTRPEFATTTAGYIDIQNLICDWYFLFDQSYHTSVINSATLELIVLTECATEFYLDNVGIGMHSSLDVITLSLTSNFAGGYIGYVVAQRGNLPGVTDHCVSINYCNDLTIDGLVCGIIQYVRSNGRPLYINVCNDIVIENAKIRNANMYVSFTNRLTVNHIDICDRYTGYTNSTSPYYSLEVAISNDVSIADITHGDNFTIPNCHSLYGLLYVYGSNRVKLRKCGTYTQPIPKSTWGINAYGFQRFVVSGGNNKSLKVQELYAETMVTTWASSTNSDKNVSYENVHVNDPKLAGTKGVLASAIANLNCETKNISGVQSLTGQTSVYGTHWSNYFNKSGYGELVLCMNEPTPETASYVNIVSGVAKFNSAGGVILPTVGCKVIWETPFWVRGTTFRNTNALMSGGTIGNYTLTYALDTGSGYSDFKSLTGANLSAEVIPASGFKMKLSILTSVTNVAAITFLRIFTLNDGVVAVSNPYPLDTNILKFTDLKAGSEVRAYVGTDPATVIEVGGVESSGTSFSFEHSVSGQTGFIMIHALGYVTIRLPITYEAKDVSIPVQQQLDRVYKN